MSGGRMGLRMGPPCRHATLVCRRSARAEQAGPAWRSSSTRPRRRALATQGGNNAIFTGCTACRTQRKESLALQVRPGQGAPHPPSTGPAIPRPGTRPDPNKSMPHLEFTDYVGEQDLREGSPDEFDGHLAPGIGVLEQPCVARAALACARGNPKFEQRGWMGEEVCYHMPGPHLGVSAACSCPPRKSRLWRTWTCCPRWCPWTRRGSQVCWNHTP